MNTPPAKHEIDKIKLYQEKGYTASYQLEEDKLKDLSTGATFSPSQVTIHDEYRYEGASNPSDMSILYILETSDGGKGSLLLPYGPTGDGALGWFMKEVTLDMEKRDC